MVDLTPAKYEDQYVNSIYTKIANHFNHTRYHTWPRIKEFVLSLDINSLVLDVGCGNGRNLNINKKITILGCDKNYEFCNISNKKNNYIVQADNLNLPYKDNMFDAIMSIAVIHHFSTHSRRIKAINELLRITRIGGLILISVWAYDCQNPKFNEKDKLIRWTLQKKHNKDKTDNSKEQIFYRYYHLFENTELDKIFDNIKNIKIKSKIFECNNYYYILEKII